MKVVCSALCHNSTSHCVLCVSFPCVGVGGNLVAIQASRISTYLHFWSIPGVLPYKMRHNWPNPCITFFSSGSTAMQKAYLGMHIHKTDRVTYITARAE